MSAPAKGSRLEARDIAVALGPERTPVLDGASLCVGPGEVVGLLGPNGAGKTTLLRVMARMIEPDRGVVEIDGVPVPTLGRRQLARRLAVVPQDTGVAFPFTAGEIVMMGRSPHQSRLGLDGAADVERARAALARLGLEALVDRSVLELSGGERQLVLFARALAQEADWLLLDEPTAFLDLRNRIDVLRNVRALAAEGRGALVVSHDLGLAARVCDRLVLLARGRVVAEGTPDEVVRPEVLHAAFGIEADVLEAPEGGRVVVPRLGPAHTAQDSRGVLPGDRSPKSG
ncbi:MAG: ABC transporter ATP-binding protein [Myxococcota bacterium]